MEQLNELEYAVLAKALSEEHPALEALRRQLPATSVRHRKFTGVGFVTELTVRNGVEPAPMVVQRATFGNVVADVNGLENGMGFLVYLEDGYIAALEGFTYGEPLPSELVLHRVYQAEYEQEMSWADQS